MTRTALTFWLSLAFAAAFASPHADAALPGRSVLEHRALAQDGNWAPAIAAALAEAGPDGIVFFPRGEYRTSAPIELSGDITLLFERGARLFTDAEDLIRIVGDGTVVLESIGGRAELANVAPDAELNERGFPEEGITSVISLDHVPLDARPNLRVKGLRLRGFTCINGLRNPEKGEMGDVEVLDCDLIAADMHMSHRHSIVHSLRVENSTFTGDVRYGLFFTSPMPGGAIVRGNVLRGVGIRAIQLSGGAANMIDDGAVNYLPSAIVHDNQILGGGHRALFTTSYIMGILVYGHNVSVQGNIVRDFNRGVPSPDHRVGHLIPLEDGGYSGIWVPTEAGRRRLAGAAIYVKARTTIISGNICSNSGWRSVIEVKTGGREPHVMVSNNIVDGRSLSAEESFGFECGSNMSVWSNNLVFDMPHIAFASRANRQNTYTGNSIYGAKIGFLASAGAAGQREIFANNRFENVEEPVRGMSEGRPGGELAVAPLVVPGLENLPTPSAELRGRIAVVLEPDGDRVLVCRRADGALAWAELTQAGAEGLVIAGADALVPVGDELAANPDHSLDAPPPDAQEGTAWQLTGNADRFPFGWNATTSGVQMGEVLAYDAEVAETGGRSLRIGDGDKMFNFLMTQNVPVEPGKLYRAQARVHVGAPDMRFTLQLDFGGRRFGSADRVQEGWNTVSVVARAPQDAPRRAQLRLWGSGAGNGKHVHIDHVSMVEMGLKVEDE